MGFVMKAQEVNFSTLMAGNLLCRWRKQEPRFCSKTPRNGATPLEWLWIPCASRHSKILALLMMLQTNSLQLSAGRWTCSPPDLSVTWNRLTYGIKNYVLTVDLQAEKKHLLKERLVCWVNCSQAQTTHSWCVSWSGKHRGTLLCMH